MSNLGANTASTSQTPAPYGFVDGKQTGHDQDQAHAKAIIYRNDTANETNRANNPPGDPPALVDIGLEKMAHRKKIPWALLKAKGCCKRKLKAH